MLIGANWGLVGLIRLIGLSGANQGLAGLSGANWCLVGLSGANWDQSGLNGAKPG